MVKRPAEGDDQSSWQPRRRPGDDAPATDDMDTMDWEDEYEDEFESEDEDGEEELNGHGDGDGDGDGDGENGAVEAYAGTFLPQRNTLPSGQSLAPDISAYEMLQVLEAPWPCLSFDIVPDDLGPQRKSYPAILYAVAGTQAASNKQRDNQILVMKLSGLSKTEAKRESEGSDDDDDDDNSDVETEPILESKSIPMTACTNRIRARQFGSATDAAPPTTITAAMAESGDVLLHDITPYLSSLDRPGKTPSPGNKRPMHTIQAHKSTEGYAVAWSPLQDEGKLLTGDVNGRIFVTTGSADATWATDQSPLVGHDSSVEELEWSPNERTVFASASSDGTVKIWDLRSKSRKAAVSVKISDVDVNVLSWSKQTPHLLAAGADDGKWSVWDLRQWKSAGVGANAEKLGAVASFNFHKAQVTSIEWHPTDDSVVLVAAGDHTVTLWDLAVELDTEEASGELGLPNVPSQLLFLHYMDEVKEAHWHPQIPGCVMATGGSGFNVFKTNNV